MGRQQPLHHRVCLPVLHLLSRLGSMPVTLHTLRGLLQQTPGTPGKLGSRHSSKLPMLPGTWSVGEAANLVFTSGTKPVTGTGDVDSDPVVFTAPGTYFWIATLWMIAGDGTRHVAAKGTCGAAGEATIVTPPGMSTTATSS